jgi:peptidoglycan/xylan/chitin deacetylase (PgdA/CDA1 family)
MPFWKYLLLNAYYYASLPERWRIKRTLAARQRTPIIVLFYHRVADDRATEWTMSNRTFIEQVSWLRKNFELISMEETQRRLRSGFNTRPALHITFDDGYADNCASAIPWLVKEQIPCTYFVTAQNIVQHRPFDHDLKAGVNLMPNSLNEVRAMADAGIEIGAHTYSHADLGKLTDPAVLEREIVTARHELQTALRRDIRYFSFPFGLYANLSCQAFHLAARSGYECVCSAYGGYNFPGDDAFHVHRLPTVCELLRMKNWLNADPRKLYTRRFDYHANDDDAAVVGRTSRSVPLRAGSAHESVIKDQTDLEVHLTADEPIDEEPHVLST